MKVVHVHRMRGIGGSERHLLTLLPALRDLGVDASFVGLDDPAWDVDPFYDALGSVPFTRLRSARDLEPALPRELAKTLRRLGPDLVHTHLVHADVYGAVATRAPVISTKHNDDPFRAGAFRFVERALAWRAHRVIAITHALRDFLVDGVGISPRKVAVVHYGLDDVPAAWAGDEASVPDGAVVLLAVSRLVEQKGIDVAVRALAAVRAEQPDAVLVVLGEGPERARLVELARTLGVEDAVLLPGRVGDVGAWYRRAALLVHPARWEGFGLAILEAMLAGLPVVASRVSSIPELVEDGRTGMLVPVDDAGALAAAIVDSLERRRELGAAGFARARAEFSVERMTRATLDVYERALR